MFTSAPSHVISACTHPLSWAAQRQLRSSVHLCCPLYLLGHICVSSSASEVG